eukprot:CAMPEP_0205800814 /NCGR_PEP_ID=MMETSP0205-20121125/2595_1 /ASSEMBLY_ACC=CAM_ASM_000278 /TAXON_ID=36767 /ORGANISM="Euplotes focardii, Strain TN1" /LENGTH=161 /DNA_ID=CAMNT_0053064523 /DNA_START=60 /DNA_END=542 /DNA_ORIENTATION=+
MKKAVGKNVKKLKNSKKASKVKQRGNRLRPLCQSNMNSGEKKGAYSMHVTPRKNSQLAETMSFIVRKDLLEYIEGKKNNKNERMTHRKTDRKNGGELYTKYSKFLTEKETMSSNHKSFNKYVFDNHTKDSDSIQNMSTQTMSQLDKFILRYGKQGISKLNK